MKAVARDIANAFDTEVLLIKKYEKAKDFPCPGPMA